MVPTCPYYWGNTATEQSQTYELLYNRHNILFQRLFRSQAQKGSSWFPIGANGNCHRCHAHRNLLTTLAESKVLIYVFVQLENPNVWGSWVVLESRVQNCHNSFLSIKSLHSLTKINAIIQFWHSVFLLVSTYIINIHYFSYWEIV